MVTLDVNWDHAKVRLSWQEDSQLPPRHLISSVHGFCFHDDKVLLVNLNQRGWDMSGGHIEVVESPEE